MLENRNFGDAEETRKLLGRDCSTDLLGSVWEPNRTVWLQRILVLCHVADRSTVSHSEQMIHYNPSQQGGFMATQMKGNCSNESLRWTAFALTTLVLMLSIRVHSGQKNSADKTGSAQSFLGGWDLTLEDSSSRISLVVGDNPGRWADQSSNGEPLGTRAAAAESRDFEWPDHVRFSQGGGRPERRHGL